MSHRIWSALILPLLLVAAVSEPTPVRAQTQQWSHDPGYASQPGVATGGQHQPQAQPLRLPPAPQPPFQLTAEQQANVNRLLSYWEMYSSRVTRYRCKFTRWQYDCFGPRDPNLARTRCEGEIKYEAPDKGLFKVDKLEHYTPQADGTYKYVANQNEQGEHWVCDGKNIFEFDYANKRLEMEELPPEMQGSGIANGPLPFLFGAKADKINERYWVRAVRPPKGKEGEEFWLQAYPKSRNDAANFKMVEVILDAKLFLPSAIQVYDPTYNPPQNYTRQVYVFHERKVNERNLLPFQRAFHNPSVPFGWKKVDKQWSGTPSVSQVTPPPARSDDRSAGRPVYDFRR